MRPFIAWVFLYLVAASGVISAETQVPAHLSALADAPVRSDFGASFKVSNPILTFSQQYLVTVWAKFPQKEIGRSGIHRLETLLKVKDSSGQWVDGVNYSNYKIPETLHKKQDIFYRSVLYFRPGAYKIVAVFADTEAHKTNVYRHNLTIPALKRDPLQSLDSHLPVVQFSSPFQLDDPSFKNPLPVPTASPTRIDVVLNVTGRTPWTILYQIDADRSLAIAQVFARLKLDQGCVRLSVIDTLRTRVIMDPIRIDRLNWKLADQLIRNVDQNVVNVKELENQRSIMQFTQDYVRKLAADSGGCPAQAAPLHPVVVMVSHELPLPDGVQKVRLTPSQNSQYYYLHVGSFGGWMDAMRQILSSSKTRILDSATPADTRHSVATILKAISQPQTSP